MARAGPKKTREYGVEFKRAAVQLSHRPGMRKAHAHSARRLSCALGA